MSSTKVCPNASLAGFDYPAMIGGLGIHDKLVRSGRPTTYNRGCDTRYDANCPDLGLMDGKSAAGKMRRLSTHARGSAARQIATRRLAVVVPALPDVAMEVAVIRVLKEPLVDAGVRKILSLRVVEGTHHRLT